MFSLLPPPNTPIDARIMPPALDTIQVAPTNPNKGLDQPRMSPAPLFETNLKLSPDREQWLVQRAIQRITEVMKEMGRLEEGRVRPGSFMGIRQENQQTYEGDLEWRKALGGIFPTSNFSLGDNNRYARLLSARERDDLLSTRPCFAAMTTDEGDPELTKDVEMYVQGRVDTSNVIETLRESIRVANIVNEAVIKTTYRKKTSRYVGPATVMADANGMPIVTKRGFYVYEKDDFVPDPVTNGIFRLQKDPSFSIQAGQGRYVKFARLPQTMVHYDNAHAKVMDSRDFLCPLKVSATSEADINAHLYEQDPDALRSEYPNIDTANAYFARRRGAQSGAMQPKRASGEDDEQQSQVLESVLIAETYIRCPIHADTGDTAEYEIMLVLDLTNGEPVFYDYLGNHMSRRPFSVIPGVERVPGRWHSIGVFTKMRNPALYVDAQVNRINEKDSQNAAVTFYHEDASEQWRSGVPFAPGSKVAIKVRPGWDPRVPICGRINLQADAALGMELMQLRRQATDLDFAVLSGRDASASDLNQSKTATGVMSVERDANVISKDTEADIVKGLEDQLQLTVELLLDNMGSTELMFRKGGSTLVTLNREEIRALPRKIKLLLTKTRSAEMLATNEKAEAIWMRYMRLNPWEQCIGRMLYLRQLKGLEVDDADELLPEVTKDEAKAFLVAQQQQHGVQPPAAPSESIAIKYGDLARSEQVQLLLKAGITPATPQEIAQKQSSEVAMKQLEKGNGSASPAAPLRVAGTHPGGSGGNLKAA